MNPPPQPILGSPPNVAVMAVVPARVASTRLPRKLLLRETGMSVLQHTLLNLRRASSIDRIVVATADAEIAAEATALDYPVEWTSPTAQCGTERLAEVAARHSTFELFVNVQGDEPELPAEYVDQLVQLMLAEPTISIGTLAAPLADPARIRDPSCVKVVLDRAKQAHYFSRAAIPFFRESANGDATNGDHGHPRPTYWQHLGIYAYRRTFLLEHPRLPVSPNERAEQLEQLRFLDAGFSIQVGCVPSATRGIDTPEDYASFVQRIRDDRKSFCLLG